MSTPSDYGKYYWCVKVDDELSEDGEIYLDADSASVTPDGALRFDGKTSEGRTEPLLVIARDKWLAFYAASCLDGSAVAVVHWRGEVDR